MEKRNYSVIVLAVISIIIFTVCLRSHAGEARGVTKDTIKIGAINDMTGPTAVIELPYIEAQRNYFRWVNENGGIHGRKIKLIVEDDRYSIPLAVGALKKLVFKDKVLCITGPSGTGQTVALFSQLRRNKIPAFAITISATMWIPYKRYIFPPPGDYADFIGVIYDYIMKDLNEKKPKIAIVRPDSEGGKVCATAAKKRADFYSIDLYGEILSVGAMDASSQVLNLKRRGVNNVIIAAMTTGDAGLVMKNGKRFGYSPNIFGVHYACGDEAIKMAGNAAKNYYGIHALSSWWEDTPEIRKLREVALKYAPNREPTIFMYQQGWYWGKILTEAIRIVGKNLNAEKIIDTLETFRDYDTNGLCGPVTYTSQLHKATNHCKMFKADVEKKRVVAISGWIKPTE